MQLEHSRRQADREHQRRVREQAERRSDEGGGEDGWRRQEHSLTTSFGARRSEVSGAIDR